MTIVAFRIKTIQFRKKPIKRHSLVLNAKIWGNGCIWIGWKSDGTTWQFWFSKQEEIGLKLIDYPYFQKQKHKASIIFRTMMEIYLIFDSRWSNQLWTISTAVEQYFRMAANATLMMTWGCNVVIQWMTIWNRITRKQILENWLEKNWLLWWQ